MKKSVTLLLTLILALGFAGIASAHVKVAPDTVAQNAYQVFTIRVPSESENVNTTQVKLEVPAGVEVSRFEPHPDWTYETEKDSDGKVTSVTWKSTGKGITQTEFVQFNFQGHVAADATELVWKAHQTYSDGNVVDWTQADDANAKTPASVTKVTAAAAGADGHGQAQAASSSESSGGRDSLTLGLAIAGLAAGVIALIVSLLRKKSA